MLFIPPLIIFLAIAVALLLAGRRSEIARYLLRRFMLAGTTLLMVSVIVFAMMEVVPGDCATRMIAFKNTQGEDITEADIQAERELRGLDGNIAERYASWAWGAAWQGSLGFSCEKRTDVNEVLGARYWVSLGLVMLGLVFSYLLAIPLGVFSAAAVGWPWRDRNPRRSILVRLINTIGLFLGRIAEVVLRAVSYLGLATPNFLIALGILVYYLNNGWELPIGLHSADFKSVPWWNAEGFDWAKLQDLLGRIWLPIFIIGWSGTALQLQTVRSLVMDENNKLYVQAARARGQSGIGLWSKYPVKHSLGPVINSVGFDFNRMFNDLPIVASIMLLTDSAQLLLEALAYTNDQQLAAGILMMITLTIIVFNYLTDAYLAITDPRFRASILN